MLTSNSCQCQQVFKHSNRSLNLSLIRIQMDEGKTSEDTALTEAVNMISNAVKSDILTGEFMGLTHFGASLKGTV